MSSEITLRFTNRVGAKKDVFPFPADESLPFVDVVQEICKKLNEKNINAINIATPAGYVLTKSHLTKNVGEIKEQFGEDFEIIVVGTVGMGSEEKNAGKAWQVGLAELQIPPFSAQWEVVGPRHPQWMKRIELEGVLLKKYLDFLKSESIPPWFKIMPDMKPPINGSIWRGYICVPSRPEIKFDMVILLSAEYPKVPPRAFVEESLIGLAGSKIYTKNRFPPTKDGKEPASGEWPKDPVTGKSFVMICHDHMSQLQGAWMSNLAIVHFFIREVWYWFAAMQNYIIEDYDKQSEN